VLGVSSSTDTKKKTISNRIHKMNVIKQKIASIYFESKQRYGSPRMTIELQILGYEISRITGAKYMKQNGFIQ
jgi:putative transposase